MTAIAHSPLPRFRQLAFRSNSGTSVEMVWDSIEDEIIVQVESSIANFRLYPPNNKAIDVYNHPFAYFDSVLMSGRYS